MKSTDSAVSAQSMILLTDRLGIPPQKGGSDDILPALAKALPGQTDEVARYSICGRVVRVQLPIAPATQPDPHQVAQAADLLRERLKNDSSARVRFMAACRLTEFGDNSGTAELKKAALDLHTGTLQDEFALDLLVPALERATGQSFGKVPLNPTFSSDSQMVGQLTADRQALLEKVAAWVKANN